MLAHDIFSSLTPDFAGRIFAFLFEKDKPVYKATIEALATKRNLRPVFVERKPRDERFAWMKDALSKPPNNGLAAHVLQVWLVGAQSALLCDFLDSLGIKHDENGTVESLPPAPERKKIDKAVEKLLTKHDPTTVAVYLHAFQALHENGGWPTLGEALEGDARLSLTASVPPVPSDPAF